jgi:hypothetical protein
MSPAAREARGSANYPRRRQRRRRRVGCRRSTSTLLYLDTGLAMQPRWCRARCVLCRRRRRRCGSRSARHREQCTPLAEAPLTDHSKRNRDRPYHGRNSGCHPHLHRRLSLTARSRAVMKDGRSVMFYGVSRTLPCYCVMGGALPAHRPPARVQTSRAVVRSPLCRSSVTAPGRSIFKLRTHAPLMS